MPEARNKLTLKRVTRIALVDRPDNPLASVVVAKRAPEEDVAKAPMKTDGGEQYPAAAYAYVPDPEKPSTWKLRLWESPSTKVTARQVGMALAAMSPGGFRGRKVQIPTADMGAIKTKVRAAWKSVHGKGDTMPPVLKSADGPFARLTAAIGKVLGWTDEDIEKVMDEVGDTKTGDSDMADDVTKDKGTDTTVTDKDKDAAPESVTKADFEAVLKKLADAEQKVTKAQEEVAKVQLERRTEQFIAKAREEYGHLPAKAEELGVILMKIADSGLSDEEKAEHERILKAANQQAYTAGIFAEFGTGSAANDGTATAIAQHKADELRKQDPKLTAEQALAKVYRDDPDLYHKASKQEQQFRKAQADAR